jgi:hypothetical protein
MVRKGSSVRVRLRAFEACKLLVTVGVSVPASSFVCNSGAKRASGLTSKAAGMKIVKKEFEGTGAVSGYPSHISGRFTSASRIEVEASVVDQTDSDTCLGKIEKSGKLKLGIPR